MTGMMAALTIVGAVTPPAPVLPSVVTAPNPCNGPYTPGGDYVITEHCFANVTGGTAPYSYHWDYVSGFTGYGMTDPNVREVWWSQSGPDFHTSVFLVTVTDALGHTAQAAVTVQFNPPA